MITLNIISPELKNEIKLKYIYRIIGKSFILIGVFLGFYAIILVSSRIVLSSYLSEVSQMNSTTNESTNNTVKAVNDVNKKLKEVAVIQKDEISWLNLLELISQNTSKDIKYNKISMDRNNGLSLTGQSKTRDGLIKIKKFLDESAFLSDVDFPISNLLEKENINFNISAKINNYEFK
ncbi:hypothetical protein L6270_03710 [Candidatus Parcubacteria bacterium]|nr:hypothetical protein [Patescibacteria group bacterium]MBU4309069.1 hypothetical protein [Patescibacteria group bacterium]MBU4432446.1 hypothetical protein [Patescibacteria group bacterium]MBU4577430.1 hypothetical protein [Patescibacteria group bacterium]MCG2697118.1 hypothetical protein [Candidatus Parcubacteria bacterium]